jgi:hypothetical protein
VIGGAFDAVGFTLPGGEINNRNVENMTVIAGDRGVDAVRAIAIACYGTALRIVTSAGADNEGDGDTCDSGQELFAV